MPFLYIDKMQNEEYVKKTDASPALEGILDENVKPSLAKKYAGEGFCFRAGWCFLFENFFGINR
jgi:hypothetical protein